MEFENNSHKALYYGFNYCSLMRKSAYFDREDTYMQKMPLLVISRALAKEE